MSKASGRMIRQTISRSVGISKLSPKALALFCLLIPHFSCHGKMEANSPYIKGKVCYLIDWLPEKEISRLLEEISEKTNMKYWEDKTGFAFLHCINWEKHQALRKDRMGKDELPEYPHPDYARTTPGLLQPEEEVEVEGKEKRKKKQSGWEKDEEPFF